MVIVVVRYWHTNTDRRNMDLLYHTVNYDWHTNIIRKVGLLISHNVSEPKSN